MRNYSNAIVVISDNQGLYTIIYNYRRTCNNELLRMKLDKTHGDNLCFILALCTVNTERTILAGNTIISTMSDSICGTHH